MFVPPDGSEEHHLGLLVWGNVTSTPHWRLTEKRTLGFFDLKGVIESLPIKNLSLRQRSQCDFALTTEILSDNQAIGFAGQLSAARAAEIDVTGPVFFAELQADFLLEPPEKAFRGIERFPGVTRDIAMIVPQKLMHADILRVIKEAKDPLLEDVQVFDVFEGGDGITSRPSGKSLAYRLTYRAKNRTLTNEEVTAAHAKIRERLKRELEVTLRE